MMLILRLCLGGFLFDYREDLKSLIDSMTRYWMEL